MSGPRSSRPLAATVLLPVLLLLACSRASEDAPAGGEVDPTSFSRGTGGVVVSEEAMATRVGVEVLKEGGNAVDAAVATAFALAVTWPCAGNIGGGGFLIAWDPEQGEPWALDFRETAPAGAHPELYVELAEQGLTDASLFGPLAAAIPGSVAGLHAAWKRGGSIPWSRLVEPAHRLAEEGFIVSEEIHRAFVEKLSELEKFDSTREIFLSHGHPPEIGERLVQAELGKVLALIEEKGPAPFYEGEVAEALVAAVREGGGLWTLEDLASYRPVFRTPARVELGGLDDVLVLTMPPPSSASVVFAQTLYFLRAQGAFDVRARVEARAVALVEALRLAFADRNHHLADPEFMKTRPETLTDPDYLEIRSRLLPAEPPGNSLAIGAGTPAGESSNTTPLVVMDDRGGAVSLTTTINSLFGSAWIARGTGILLNNEMDDFDTRPGIPNQFGLIGTGFNVVRPGARMLSSMSPTLVLRNDQVWLALGSRGGPRILTSILQVLLHRCAYGLSLVEAVCEPRLHHQWLPDRVDFEEDGRMEEISKILSGLGYEIGTLPDLGRVTAAERLEDGRFLGVVDPRMAGLAAAVSKDN